MQQSRRKAKLNVISRFCFRQFVGINTKKEEWKKSPVLDMVDHSFILLQEKGLDIFTVIFLKVP